jgi:cytochrome o ubiquinol oxidase operon protein cyoD
MQTQSIKPLVAYVIGYVLSVILTILAYVTVTSYAYSYEVTIVLIVCFAVIQLFVQLLFFLHLGREAKPRWRLVMLGFGILVISILVFGSLWIMDNLNYTMMQAPDKTKSYIDRQGGF